MASDKLYGYMGRILRVDLTRGRFTEETLDESILRKYLGGVGIGAYYLYKEVLPGVEWSDPENSLILAVGPLNGLRLSGSGIFSVTTKGSMTCGATSSQANGFWGAYLKFCGFDAIVIRGKAENPVYLYVQDGHVELRDASHLRGKDTWETESLIKQELGKKKRELSVFSMGPAGENLVRFACLVGDEGHVASKNGIGAVMGSKNLKAMAVARGRRRISVQDIKKLDSLIPELFEEVKKGHHYLSGTSESYGELYPVGQLPVKNYTTNLFPEHDKFHNGYPRTHFEIKANPCYACKLNHCHIMKVTEGPYAGYVGEEPDYEQWAAWSSVIGQTDPGAAVMLANEVDRLGLDNNEAGWVIAWLMECFEKEVMTRNDLGIDMRWGDAEAARTMLRKIAFRQDIGNLLAEGVMRAATKIGGEAENMAIFTLKGNAPRTHDHRARWFELLDTCVSSTGTYETHYVFKREKLGLPKAFDPFSPEEVSMMVAKTKGFLQLEDSAVMCRFTDGADPELLCKIINAVTGWNFTVEKAMEIGRRIVNLLKVFNIRHGITAERDVPSARYSSMVTDGPAQGKSIKPFFKDMLRNYYTQMGWDTETSKPLPSTLERLELEHTIADIWEKEEVSK